MTGAVAAAINAVLQRLVTLVADMGLAAAYSSFNESSGTTQNWIEITFNPDGTWAVTDNASALFGTPTTGNWGTPTTPGTGENYELLISSTGSDGTFTNDAPTYTQLTTAKKCRLTVNDPTADDGSNVAFRDITATIRKIGTTSPTSTDTTTVTVEANRSTA